MFIKLCSARAPGTIDNDKDSLKKYFSVITKCDLNKKINNYDKCMKKNNDVKKCSKERKELIDFVMNCRWY